METIAYLAAILIGVSLASLGGGGAILTVPVFVYLLQVNPVLATTYSLFVVGACSLVGGIRAFLAGLVDVPLTLYFGSSSFLTVFLVRYFLVQAIPDTVLTAGGIHISKDSLLMTLFAILMLVAAFFIIRSALRSGDRTRGENRVALNRILAYGMLVGAITGLLGVGGGFLIIPALVLWGRLPMKMAVGSSLTIIAGNSFFGFFSTLSYYTIDWAQLLSFTLVALTGIYIGGFVSRKVSAGSLKAGFGWFILLIGFAILARELLVLADSSPFSGRGFNAFGDCGTFGVAPSLPSKINLIIN